MKGDKKNCHGNPHRLRSRVLAVNNYKAIVVALILCLSATAQTESKARFQWDWQHAQELDFKPNAGNVRELSEGDRSELIKAISRQIRTVMEPGPNPRALAKKTRVKLFDLNGDGIPEIIAQPIGIDAGCGATGNCPFWIFQKDGEGYKLLLRRMGFWVFTVEPTITNGFRDIVLASHESASERTVIVFRYSGGTYQERACYNAFWYDSTNHRLNEPTITRCRK